MAGQVSKCLDMHVAKPLRECQSHAQHVRLAALNEVLPCRETLFYLRRPCSDNVCTYRVSHLAKAKEDMYDM